MSGCVMAFQEGFFTYNELVRNYCSVEIENHQSSIVLDPETEELLSQSQSSIAVEEKLLTNHNHPVQINGFPLRSDHAAVAVGNTIYSFGGYIATGPQYQSYSRDDTLDVLVVNVNECEPKWQFLSVDDNDFIPNQRWGHSAVAHNEVVLIFGGFNMKKNQYSNSTHLFDKKTFKWEKILVSGTVPKPRADHSGVVVANEMIIFGGLGATNDLYSLNLDTFHWSTIKTKGIPPSRRYSHSATVYKDNFVLIFGGLDDMGKLSNELFCFDVNSKEWTHPTMTGTTPQGRRGHSAFIQSGLIFILGGISASGSCLNDLFCINPESWKCKEVKPIQPSPSPRAYFGCVALDNRAFIFGGWNLNKIKLQNNSCPRKA